VLLFFLRFMNYVVRRSIGGVKGRRRKGFAVSVGVWNGRALKSACLLPRRLAVAFRAFVYNQRVWISKPNK
jgi:hypothetical protein